jgi:hypothetical protein
MGKSPSANLEERMISVTGVFTSRSDAQRGSTQLLATGIPKDRINLLTPGASEKELGAVPVDSAEQPGMGKAIGAAVGGAVGLAGGIGLGGAVASLMLPGIGPVIAVGAAGAALLGMLGFKAGGAIEQSMTNGLPEDELFVYEDALRQGRSVVIADADNDIQAKAARGVLENAGAESIDRVRDMWWVGVRGAQKEKYDAKGGHFDDDERFFRCGFESALHLQNRDKSYDQCRTQLATRHPELHEREPFRRGFEEGRAYLEAVRNRHN